MASDWARPVVHWELVARDPARQSEFYRQMFNWEIGEGPIRAIAPGLGGPEPGPAGHIRQGERSGVSLYVQVADLRSTLDRVPGLGGRSRPSRSTSPTVPPWPSYRTRRATRWRWCSSKDQSSSL